MGRSISGDVGGKMSKLPTFGKPHNEGPNWETHHRKGVGNFSLDVRCPNWPEFSSGDISCVIKTPATPTKKTVDQNTGWRPHF